MQSFINHQFNRDASVFRAARIFALASVLLLLQMTPIMSMDESLRKSVQDLMPTNQELKHLKIPWQTDFVKARNQAEKENKPLFVWMMNGNPLGCTS